MSETQLTPTTVTALKRKNDNPAAVRKLTHAVAYMAPMSAKLPTALTNENGQLLELPKEWIPFGLVSQDGYTFGADTDKSEVNALGYVDPVRTDITKVARTIKFTAFETWKKNIIELTRGIDLSSTSLNTGSELVFDLPSVPELSEYRFLIIKSDGPASAEFLQGRAYPRVKLAEIPEETWNQEDPEGQEITVDVFPDAELGTPCREYFGGTGMKKYKDVLGHA